MPSDFFSVWLNVLTHPSVATFEAQKPNATKDRTMMAVIIAAVVSAVLAFILSLVFGAIATFVATIVAGYAVPFGIVPALKSLFSNLVQTFAGFYIFAWVLQYAATRFFGGKGNFDEQAYLISTYWAPISILTAVLAFIPCIGWIAALVLLVYGVVLTTYAVQAGQGMAIGTAVLNWIVAGVITGVMIGILGFITGGWL